ncbi:GntR family transcriptional regulator [Cohnella faecalis]|uniref:GntR family transcriptional regulator n=1 Tax=Cohnella faecalis TaxID=2315694 RepID=A0A398CKK0_9BACL|nr:GntR family transcriptional regulator [Cohnella faecalis]RIE03243.1 GntR family transcriptional regulator [Cohnella faecalis]
MLHRWLEIRSDSPLPLHAQLTEQLKWLVGSGRLSPNDLLSPVASLAHELGVNRNTVQAVYMQLREEGIVETRQGHGSWIADTEATRKLIIERQASAPVARGLLDSAEEAGFDVERFVYLSMAALQLQALKDRRPRVLFVDSRLGEHAFFLEEIRRVTGGQPAWLALEELRRDLEGSSSLAGRYDIIVTTSAGMDELRCLLPSVADRAIRVEAALDLKMIAEMARLGESREIGVVCAEPFMAGWLAERLAALGSGYTIALAGDRESLRSLLGRAANVYAAPSVYDDVKSLAPEKTSLLSLVLETSSEYLLADLKKNY